MADDILSVKTRARLFDIFIKSAIAAVLSASVGVQTWTVQKLYALEQHQAVQDASYVTKVEMEAMTKLTTKLDTNQVQVMSTLHDMALELRQTTNMAAENKNEVAENNAILRMLRDEAGTR